MTFTLFISVFFFIPVVAMIPVRFYIGRLRSKNGRCCRVSQSWSRERFFARPSRRSLHCFCRPGSGAQAQLLAVLRLNCWQCLGATAGSAQAQRLAVLRLNCWQCSCWTDDSAHVKLMTVLMLNCWLCSYWTDLHDLFPYQSNFLYISLLNSDPELLCQRTSSLLNCHRKISNSHFDFYICR